MQFVRSPTSEYLRLPSVRQSIRPSVGPYVRPSVRSSINPSSVRPFVHPYVRHPSFCTYVRPFVCPSFCTRSVRRPFRLFRMFVRPSLLAFIHASLIPCFFVFEFSCSVLCRRPVPSVRSSVPFVCLFTSFRPMPSRSLFLPGPPFRLPLLVHSVGRTVSLSFGLVISSLHLSASSMPPIHKHTYRLFVRSSVRPPTRSPVRPPTRSPASRPPSRPSVCPPACSPAGQPAFSRKPTVTCSTPEYVKKEYNLKTAVRLGVEGRGEGRTFELAGG